MKEWKYDYTICPFADNKVYRNQCATFEKNIPDIVKTCSLIDVDGTGITEYDVKGKTIRIVNDYDTGALYVQSDIELK